MTDRDGEAQGYFLALLAAINAAAEPREDVRRPA
jgi:hypothetical protein